MQFVLKALAKIISVMANIIALALCCYITTAIALASSPAVTTVVPATQDFPLPFPLTFPFTEPQFEQVSDAAMLDDKAITALAQDTRGLIWIGTQHGLIRFDGYRFRKFAHKVSDPFSLAGNYVFTLRATKDGRLWIGTFSDGVSVFDPASERFQHFRHDPKNPDSLGGGPVLALAEDQRGGMWFGTSQGLHHLPGPGQRFLHFRHGADPHSLMDDTVRSLLPDRDGRLWVGGNSGLQRLAKDGKSFETVISGANVQNLFQARDGKLWLGTREHGAAWLMPGVVGPNPARPAVVRPNGAPPDPSRVNWLPLTQLNHDWGKGIVQLQTDQIWLAGADGIQVVAAGDGRLLRTLRHDPTLPRSLALNSVKPLLLDRSGWLWVGTWGGGLQRMNANNRMVQVLRHSPNQPYGLSHPNVRSILELANGNLLFGSFGNGIDVVDRQRGLIKGYRQSHGQGQPGSLPNSTIYAMAQTRDGSVWAGTQTAGVVRQLAGSEDWVAVPGLPPSQVRTLFASRDGSLWVGTERGVARWQPDTAQTTKNADPTKPAAHFEILKNEQGQALQSIVHSIVEDRQGRIWIGTVSGLWVQEPGRRGLIAIHAQPNQPHGLVSDFILGLLVDRHDRLWVSTDKGLERLRSRDDKQAQFEHISALLGQPGKAMGNNLLEDHQGRIWTEEGAIEPVANGHGEKEPFRLRVTPINKADGMDIGATWRGSFYQTRDGLLLYGGAKGVAIIDPGGFSNYDYAPPLVVTELKINGETVPPQSLVSAAASSPHGPDAILPASQTANLTLPPQQRNFALEFAALDYAEPKKNRYQYRLQGYDKRWIDADAEHRSAAYGNLWPGQYTLHVRGSNRMGDWSRHELKITIKVLPAWWQTWWFGLLLLLSVTAGFAALMQVRTRYLRKRQRELEQQVQERTGELQQKQIELVEANNGLLLSVDTLRQLGDIGREITANLDADTVFQSLYLHVNGLLKVSAMTIYRMNDSTTALDAVFGLEDDKAVPAHSLAFNSPTSRVAKVARERQELLMNMERNDNRHQLRGTRPMLTALFAPLIVDDRVLGVMSIQSDQPNAYGERERLIFRTLSSYGAIALANVGAMAALHKAQGQLVQQEKMASLGNLVAGIAHEINTPLGTTLVAISGSADAWQGLKNASAGGHISRAVLESSTRTGIEYTTLALKTATRAAELIAVFKSIAINTESDNAVTLELAHYLPEVATLVSTQLKASGCKLELEVPPGISLHIVSEALTEALTRVLLNVFDHAFADGRIGTLCIRAQLDQAAGEVLISVSDNGHGIAPQDLPKVFDPFFTTKSGIGGHVGLGLHVAWNHVTQRLKGQIRISSTPGEGSKVEIRLKQTG